MKLWRSFTITKKAPTRVLNMEALVGAFNQEMALVGAFSVIVQPVVEPMEHYTALALILSIKLSQAPVTVIAISVFVAGRGDGGEANK